MLEQTDLPVHAVARRVGLANAVSLRPQFRPALGVSPRTYRDTFASPADRVTLRCPLTTAEAAE